MRIMCVVSECMCEDYVCGECGGGWGRVSVAAITGCSSSGHAVPWTVVGALVHHS